MNLRTFIRDAILPPSADHVPDAGKKVSVRAHERRPRVNQKQQALHEELRDSLPVASLPSVPSQSASEAVG